MPLEEDYNLDDLMISQNFNADLVKKQVVVVPVCKPNKSLFIRVNPNPDYYGSFYTLEINDSSGKELYLVSNNVTSEVFAEFHQYMKAQTIFTCVTRQGDVFLFPVPQPRPDRDNQWWSSLREAAVEGMQNWIRVVANQGVGAYDVFLASGPLPEPTFPEESFKSLLLKGFKGKIINSLDHEALNKLRGLS